MNSSQRRKQIMVDCKSTFVDIPEDLHGQFENGAQFTIKGYHKNKDGSMTTNCDAGDETVFTAKYKGKYNAK